LLAIINDKDDNKDEYHDNGIYYLKPQMVLKQSAPLVLKCLLYLKRPNLEVNETNNYYYGGFFMRKWGRLSLSQQQQVPSCLILPEGEEVKLRSDLCAVWGNVLPANTT
jgi:hypothetical protein